MFFSAALELFIQWMYNPGCLNSLRVRWQNYNFVKVNVISEIEVSYVNQKHWNYLIIFLIYAAKVLSYDSMVLFFSCYVGINIVICPPCAILFFTYLWYIIITLSTLTLVLYRRCPQPLSSHLFRFICEITTAKWFYKHVLIIFIFTWWRCT